jgi:hypothetical protein
VTALDVVLVLIWTGLALGILGLLALWQPILSRLERWADKRAGSK